MLKFCKSVENFDIFCAPMASEVGDKCVYRQRCKVVDRAISCPGQLSESIACRAVRSGECRRYTLGPTLLDLRFKRRLIIPNKQHIPTGADTTLRHSRRKLPGPQILHPPLQIIICHTPKLILFCGISNLLASLLCSFMLLLIFIFGIFLVVLYVGAQMRFPTPPLNRPIR